MTVRQRSTKLFILVEQQTWDEVHHMPPEEDFVTIKILSHLSKILFILGPKSFAHTWFVLIAKNNHWVLRENDNPDLQKFETFQLDTRNI